MSDQHKISFLDEEKSLETPKKKDNKPEKTIQQLSQEQKSKKLNNKYDDSGIMNGQSIFSAKTGVIKDNGGPTKYTKSESSNTLWDSNKTARQMQEIDSKTKTIQDKQVIVDNKRHAEKQRMDTLIEALKGTDQRKTSAVTPSGPSSFSGTNYKNQSNHMSMFDTQDFERLPEKTAGEQISEENASRKDMKDDSWRGGGKSVTAKDFTTRFFDSLMQKKDE